MSTPTRQPIPTAPAPWAELLEASTEAMALLDEQGRVRWANPAFVHWCGQAPADRPLAELLPAPDSGLQPALAALLAEAWRSGQAPPDLPELSWSDALGQPCRAQASLRPLSAAEPGLRWLWRLRDTSALARTEAALARVNERLTRAQEFGRLAMFERELPMGRGQWDAQMFRLWNLDPALGAPSFEDFARRIHPDDRPGLDYRASAQQPGKYAKRYRITDGAGGWRHVHAQWEVQVGPDGRPCLIAGVMVDDTEVYQLAESLHQASEELALAVALGHIATWRLDLKTRRVHYNDKALQVVGVQPRPEGVPLAEVRALIHPDDLPRVLLVEQEALKSRKPIDMEARYRHPDGSYHYVLSRRVLRRNAEDEPVEFLGVALDVTEQVAETRRVQELAKRLEVATAAAGLGIWTGTPDAVSGEWNEQMFRIYGRDPAAGVPTREAWLERIVHPDDRERMRAARAGLVAAEGVTVEHEFRIIRPDGELRWLVNRVRHERREQGSVLFGITMDVTERVRTEAALRQAHERITLAAHGAGIGTWEHDVSNDTAFWDEQMYRLRGLSPDCGRSPDELRVALAHPEDLPRIRQAHADAQRERRPCAYEFRVRQPDGSYRWLASRSLPVSDDSGRVVRQVGLNWDVHERVVAEAERQEKLIAQRESQAKSAFLSRMSHELRTPLNAVLGFTQLLQADATLQASGAARAKLGHIVAAGEHLLSLIDDVLDLSGVQSGELRLQLQPLPLAGVLQEALSLVEPAASAAGVRLQAAPTEAWVLADRIRTRQVLLNLLSNAVKYNRRGGEVQLQVQAEAEAVHLVVSDTGRGMTAQQLSQLFEPFNRLGMEREGIEGSGIGLAVVRALVDRMNGRVQVHSTPGQGSRFEVMLPRHTAGPEDLVPGPAVEPDAPPAETPRTRRPGPARHGRLLYIEDNPVNVLLVEELVQTHAGLQIESATSGRAGVVRAAELRPDLILVDMQLPDMNGFEVLKQLRAQPATAATPCIVLSANAMPEDIERATRAGFADYWTKPIHFGHFLEALDRLFPPRSGSAG